MQRYMKSEMPYLGVPSPALREVCRDVFARHPITTSSEWQQAIRALWHAAEFREERYAALALVGLAGYRRFRTLEALPLYEELIVSGAWWDLVDGLASHEVGDLLRQHPEPMRQTVLAWSRGADHWLRRTSIICQIGSKRATDQQLLYACIEPSLGERDFFLRKAIGWALRAYARAAPDAVRAYVAEHERELSPLSRREAMKHLTPEAPRLQSAAASV